MKRQQNSSTLSSSRKRAAFSAAAYFTTATVLLVEDGREDGVSAKRCELFVKKIEAAGSKTSVRVLKASHITHGNRLSAQDRDKRLLHVTHVVTGLEALGARGVLEGLHVIDAGDPTPAAPLPFAVVTPEWLVACFQQQRLVDTKEYALPFEPTPVAPPTPPAPPAPEKGKPSNPPPRTRAEIEALLDAHYPADMDAETRAAFIAWGGPLEIRKGSDMPRYAFLRPTPRQHPNQHLTRVLEEVQAYYRCLENEGDNKNKKNHFGQVLGIVRAWPRRITDAVELKGAHHIGKSTLREVEQILERGTTERLEGFQTDARSVAHRDLCRVHQVGAATAAKWYAARYHSVQQIMDELDAAPDGDLTQTAFYQTLKPPHEPWMGVVHFRDYAQPMDRTTVAELEALVKQAALTVLGRVGLGPETLLIETCGSYRRGKEWSNDADILVSCTDAEAQKRLREAVKCVLRDELGYDLIVLKEGAAVQGYSAPSTRIEHEAVEAHNNMLALLKFKGRYRRLDIISPPPDQWGACVLGWSGTTQLEKEIRDYTKEEKGWYFTQQALFDRDSGARLLNPASADGIFHDELSIWAFLGLRYLPPRLRWA